MYEDAVDPAEASLAEIRILLFQQATLIGQLIAGLELVTTALDRKPSRAESWRQVLLVNAITLLIVIAMFGLVLQSSRTNRKILNQTAQSVHILTECTTPDVNGIVHKCFDDANDRTGAAVKVLQSTMLAIAQCEQIPGDLAECVQKKLAPG